jgi:pimeloyl-ACP methyl ester carboxylesterase
MRARFPDCEGEIVRDGVPIHFEQYGHGQPVILLLPTWSLLHSRHWKLQIPCLARHFTVVCFDGRGNGRSGRPSDATSYADDEFVAVAVAVMGATGSARAVLVGVSLGAVWALRLAAERRERVLGMVLVGPAVPLTPRREERQVERFDALIDEPVGWETYNAHHWTTNYVDFVEFFVSQIFTEPHSTKPIEDAIGWALETDGATLVASARGAGLLDVSAVIGSATDTACPVMVIHGTDDAIRPYADGRALAERTGGSLVTLVGSGHCPHIREPVRVNHLIKSFAERVGR